MQRAYITRGYHSLSQLYAHLVFVTRHRAPSIDPGRADRLASIMAAICIAKGAELIRFGAENETDKTKPANHVHLLVRYPPTISISELVQHLKGASSRRLSQEEDGAATPSPSKDYRKRPFSWSSSYFAKSVGHTSAQATADYVIKDKIAAANRTA